MIQYEPNKPTKFGIKARCLAEAESGYVLDFKVYEGKSDKAGKTKGFSMTEKIVSDFMSNWKNMNYILQIVIIHHLNYANGCIKMEFAF